MDTWELNLLGIADWRDPRWKLAGLLDHLTIGPDPTGEGRYPAPPEGAVVELGVYRGKCLVALALALPDREVWGYDGFAGLPEFGAEDRIWDGVWRTEAHVRACERLEQISPGRAESRTFDDCSLEQVHELAHAAQVDVRLAQCWPPCGGPDRIAAASLDCDLYSSYATALPWVWGRLVPGGYVHLDEYYSLKYPGPRRFVDEWLEREGLGECLKMHPRVPHEFDRWYLVKPS